MSIYRIAGIMLVALAGMAACRPSDILDVPPPTGEFTGSAVQGPTAALQAFYGAKANLFAQIGGSQNSTIEFSGLLGDEFTWTCQIQCQQSANVDARATAATTNDNTESSDAAVSGLIAARSSLVLARQSLQQYASKEYSASIGEAYALIGYAELLMAEDYCAGVTLSQALPQGGWSYGEPLSTDSLLLAAEADFESALAHVGQPANDTVQYLASVGLGRTLMDRDSIAEAATAVTNVPVTFVYNSQLDPTNDHVTYWGYNLYENMVVNQCGAFTVSDHEGGNGLAFISAQDPRLVLDSVLQQTNDGCYGTHAPDAKLYYPLKFDSPSTGLIPLATGIEAQLIGVEAALAADANDGGWLADLNALRNNGCTGATNASCNFGSAQLPAQPSGLLPLTDPGTDTGRVSLLFRERAFWLFGTGERLSDLRRLVRQYQRPSESVYPSGPYSPTLPNALFPNYGTDVVLTLPTALGSYSTTNPHYKGCIAPTTQA